MEATPPPSLEALERLVHERPLPRHVGLSMGGSGRWAEARGQPRLEGHREGTRGMREVTHCARRLGVEALTFYALSQEGSRSREEEAALMELLREYLEGEREGLLEHNIRLHTLGEVDTLPPCVREPLDRLRAESEHNTGMVLTLALSYGGREELVRAVRRLAEAALRGEVEPAHLDAQGFESYLWTSGLPPVDLVVLTSGEQRLSNFLLWQVAYAELCFSDVLWPDFKTEAFLRCLSQYQQRERRFGLTSAQLKPGTERARVPIPGR